MKNRSIVIGGLFFVSVLTFTSCSKKTSAAEAPAVKTETSAKPQNDSVFNGLLAKMDTNKDGKLSLSEATGPLKDDFSTIDTNKDGFLTKEEYNNASRIQGRK